MAICDAFHNNVVAHQKESANKPLNIVEIFPSIQGEGKDTGVHALFIRLYGCNLFCDWCDTKYSWSPDTPPREYTGNELTDTIHQYYARYNNKYIIWTGGEPLLQEAQIYGVIEKTRDFYHHIETNGTIIPAKPYLFNSICVSPKEGNFHPRWLTIKNATIKLAVDTIEEAILFQETFQVPPHRFYVMARSINYAPGVSGKHQLEKEKILVTECIKHGFNFSTRLQAIYELGKGQ